MERRLMDISGIPFVVEEREDGLYAVGIKVRKRMIKFEGSGLPVDVVEKIDGIKGDEKINGVEEIEDFLEGQPEGAKLEDIVPSEYASDEDMTDAWQEALRNAQAGGSQS
jgi:hypothetical protein